MIGDFRPDGETVRFLGIYPAIVTNVVDPDGIGRVELRFPFLGERGKDVRAWGTLVTPYADDNQGLFILPAVDSAVAVGFEAGDLRRPYVMGAMWTGRSLPPVTAEKANDKRAMRTRSGSVLEFDDAEGRARITLTTSSGHRLVLDEGEQVVTLAHSAGMSLVMEQSGQVTLNANSTLEINASAVNVNSDSATFSGVVSCRSLVASVSVSAPLYSQGAGNIW